MICVLMKMQGMKELELHYTSMFLEYAKSIGCHNVTLNVWEGNDSAIKFYENIGMKIQKVSMEQIL